MAPTLPDRRAFPLAAEARTYMLARILVGAGLLAVFVALHASATAGEPQVGLGLWLLLLAYAVQAVVLAALRQRLRGFLLPIAVDLAVFSGLHVMEAPGGLDVVALLVLPVLMGGVLLPRRHALAVAAVAALVLLVMGWLDHRAGAAAALRAAGLAGMGLFLVAWIAGEITARLRGAQRAARGSFALARRQTDLNRLIINEMAEGVLVVDAQGSIVAANPAARLLLSLRGDDDSGTTPKIGDRLQWKALHDLVRQGFADGHWPERAFSLAWHDERGRGTQVRVRARAVAEPGRGRSGAPVDDADAAQAPALCVLLVEDEREAAQRLQQERLAAMGRVSAGLAHEIRNPLSAIVQANALMAEEGLPADQRRLTSIVGDNARRLQRVVDDVLEAVSPGEAVVQAVELNASVAELLAEWRRTAGAPEPAVALRLADTPAWIAFDGEHLRRLLVNLLDNGWTHATHAVASLSVRVQAADPRSAQAVVTLEVANDGPPIDAAVAERLFEPFFSTRSRGTGLGLYLCRELCRRHDARIEHVGASLSPGSPSAAGARFIVAFRPASAPTGDHAARAALAPAAGPVRAGRGMPAAVVPELGAPRTA